jgi:hypothetical protein
MEYTEFRKRGQEQSVVWLNFLRSVDHKTAKCKKCNKILKAEGGSTSGLKNHLKLHGITGEITEPGPSSSQSNENTGRQDQGTKKKLKIDDYFQNDQSMDWKVARMVCLDGIPFQVFVNSVDLRRLFKQAGHQLPSSPNTIRKLVIQRYDTAKREITEDFTKLKKSGLKCSITMDEWTSTAKRRYINVNIHSEAINTTKHFYNIGLIRIRGSATASTCSQLLNDRLQEYKLNLDDIVGLSTDGASVMVKMGRNLPLYHQLCYAHGLQLAILDVMYKNQPNVPENDSEDEHNSESEISDLDTDGEDDESFNLEQPRRRVPISNADNKVLVEKVRRVCKIFRNSPTKNDQALQKYVKQTFDKELHLILDCKTRWSSLASMLERFILLYSCIQKALIDIKSEIRFDTVEIDLLTNVHKMLEIFKGALELICENEANLLTADFVLKYCLSKLKEIPGTLSKSFQMALKKRIEERYQPIQGVLKYLDNPNDFYTESESDVIFLKPSPDDIVSIIMALLKRNESANSQDVTAEALDAPLTADDEPTQSSAAIGVEASDTIAIQSTSQQIKKTMRDEMKKKIMSTVNQQSSPASLQEALCPNAIRFEMALYDGGGTRGRFLEMAHKMLVSIKPTSVECERTFSTAGYLCSRYRSRMNDETINSLVVLRHYLMSKQRSN